LEVVLVLFFNEWQFKVFLRKIFECSLSSLYVLLYNIKKNLEAENLSDYLKILVTCICLLYCNVDVHMLIISVAVA